MNRLNDLASLEQTVQRDLNSRLSDFRLQISSGGLVLLGRASSFYVKQLAQHSIMNATKLPILANQIEVCSAN